MVDTRSPRHALTVQLPPELIEELQMLARDKALSVDDLVMDACLAYTEPYGWERAYKDWCQSHRNQP